MLERPPLTRQRLLDYFVAGAVPRAEFKVGMEVERLGRRVEDGAALPYDGATGSVRAVLEFLLARRGGDPVYEAANQIGIDAPWGTISLEPGGQVEWSSWPRASLDELERELREHQAAMVAAGQTLGVRWLDAAVDPALPVEAMPWMPKARYRIMREFLGKRGRLAHRMMTQTASVQCAFDHEDPADWARKFRVAALLSPVAIALFANSARADGRETDYRCFRQAIWRETDPGRCGIPDIVFDAGFDAERWLDWVLSVPTIFRHRARGLVPLGGIPFAELLLRVGCDAVRAEDWETHASTIFTEVRSYSYIEVRSADGQSDEDAFCVPCFWTGLLYNEEALETALALGRHWDESGAWRRAMDAAARHGLDGLVDGKPLRELAREAVAASRRSFDRKLPCAGESGRPRAHLERLLERCR